MPFGIALRLRQFGSRGPVSSYAVQKSETGSSCVRGIGVSPGVVVGVAHRVESVFGSFEAADAGEPEPGCGRGRAVRPRRRRGGGVLTRGYIHNVAQEVGDSEAEIFKSHLQIVNDPSLRSKVRTLIENQRLTALSALQAVMNGYAAQFAQIKQEMFRERMTDIRDVILTIESHLSRRNVGPAIRAGASRNGAATATATSRSSWWLTRSFPARR